MGGWPADPFIDGLIAPLDLGLGSINPIEADLTVILDRVLELVDGNITPGAGRAEESRRGEGADVVDGGAEEEAVGCAVTAAIAVALDAGREADGHSGTPWC